MMERKRGRERGREGWRGVEVVAVGRAWEQKMGGEGVAIEKISKTQAALLEMRESWSTVRCIARDDKVR
jgi:hypothetical protein